MLAENHSGRRAVEAFARQGRRGSRKHLGKCDSAGQGAGLSKEDRNCRSNSHLIHHNMLEALKK
jgi:hypothetical protein